MTLYIYESHMGGLYVQDYEADYESLYCEECGDSDCLVAVITNEQELADFLKQNADLFGSGGYDLDYLQRLYDECIVRLIKEG